VTLTTYTYRVRATNALGDSSYSNEATATTLDSLPPLPNPSQWIVWPTRSDINDTVYMQAVTASDATTGVHDPVWYYFDCTQGTCHDSPWQLSPVYTTSNSSHCMFVVRTKDNIGNIGQNSPSWYTGDPHP
jgi:hypothetical protein